MRATVVGSGAWGALAGAGIAAVVWCSAYQATGGSLAVGLVGFHVLAGLALAAWTNKWSPRSALGAGALAIGLLVGLPAGLELLLRAAGGVWGTSGRLLSLGALAVGGLGTYVLARSRLGALAVMAATLTAVGVLVSNGHSERAPRSIQVPPISPGSPVLGRVAVLGVDGADWSVIDPLIREGELPHLAQLMRRGVHGVLRSIEPMYSPVVWTSIFTGATPEQHGIRGWYAALATNRRVPLLWEIVGAAGATSTVLNVPGTWPPHAFPGGLVSGFPLPQLVVSEAAAQGQFVGRVLATGARSGSVPSERYDGKTADVSLGRVQVLGGDGLRNPVLDRALRRRWLAASEERLPIAWETEVGEEPARLRVDGQLVELGREAWSDWIDIEVASRPAFVRVRRIGERNLYVTPPFSSARAPLHAFTAGRIDPAGLEPGGHYVVEGVGWKAAGDADLGQAIHEHLEQVEGMHVDAALQQARGSWRLLAFVFTLTDRIQHAFWRFHDPEPYGGVTALERAAHGERVRDAYRRADAAIGALLDAMGPDVSVFIVSDHGAAPDLEREIGGHRAEGVIIAAGPGVRAAPERQELSVLDVTPTLLAGMGLPVARDMAGAVRTDLFDRPIEITWIDSYGDAGAGAASDRIDESTEEQLRALGYVE